MLRKVMLIFRDIHLYESLTYFTFFQNLLQLFYCKNIIFTILLWIIYKSWFLIFKTLTH